MPIITIITITRWNTIHLPQEVLQHLGNCEFVKVRFARGKLRIYPYDKSKVYDYKAIPVLPERAKSGLPDDETRRNVTANTKMRHL